MDPIQEQTTPIPHPQDTSRRDSRWLGDRLVHQENINMPPPSEILTGIVFFWSSGVQAAPIFVLLPINQNWAAQKAKLHLYCLSRVTPLLFQDPSVCCTQWGQSLQSHCNSILGTTPLHPHPPKPAWPSTSVLLSHTTECADLWRVLRKLRITRKICKKTLATPSCVFFVFFPSCIYLCTCNSMDK